MSDMNSIKPRGVVVVDPISTGAHVLDYLINTYPELKIVTVYSPDLSPAAKSLIVPGLKKDVAYTIDAAELTPQECVDKLRELPLQLTTITPMSEPGVFYSDALNALMPELAETANDPRFGAERRNKYDQSERIASQNIPTIPQKRIQSYAECVEWMEKNPQADGFVIKPLEAAGSESVYKIQTGDYDKLKHCIDITLGKKNKMNMINTSLLVQQFAVGAEYVIDAVTYKGQTKLACCWKYSKVALEQGDFVYEGMTLVNPQENPIVADMFEYVKNILKCLGIQNGSSHSEIIYNPTTNQFRLIELGARPHGGNNTFEQLQVEVIKNSLKQIVGDQIYCCAYPEKAKELFLDKYPDIYEHLPNVTGVQIDLINYHPDGILKKYDEVTVEKFKALPAFRGFAAMPEVNEMLPRTIDCFTVAGSVLFVGESHLLPDELETARQLERTLFVVE